MAINPMALVKLKDRLKIFREEHPKVGMFLRAVRDEGLEPGAVLELKVMMTDGRERVMNIRLTENDIETIQIINQSR